MRKGKMQPAIYDYKNLYTILGISFTPIMIDISVIPTGRSTSRFAVTPSIIGCNWSDVIATPFVAVVAKAVNIPLFLLSKI
jgi:hypothetical protein